MITKRIQFHETTWVIMQKSGGFDGGIYYTEAVQIEPTPFTVLSITRDKKTQCSTIWVWNDGVMDGDSVDLINVPNGVYKQINDEDNDG